MLHSYKYSANFRAESQRPIVKLDFWEMFALHQLLIASKGMQRSKSRFTTTKTASVSCTWLLGVFQRPLARPTSIKSVTQIQHSITYNWYKYCGWRKLKKKMWLKNKNSNKQFNIKITQIGRLI